MFFDKSLAACPSCSCQYFVEEPACPHCGAAIAKPEGKSFPRTAASLAMGLALAAIPLAACGDDTSGTGGGGGAGSGGSRQTSSDASTTDASSTSSVAAAYGVGPSSSSGGDGGDDTSSSIAAAYGMGANAGF